MNNTTEDELKQVLERKPKVLIFDIESTPHIGYFWGDTWETSIVETIEYGQILSYSAKWLGEKAVVRGWIDTGQKKQEKPLIKELRDLFDEADVIVSHNGKQFDDKYCKVKFVLYGIPLPSPYRVLDTKLEAKKHIRLPSYKLDNIADYFGLGRKLHHEGFDLWKRCMKGDKSAWAKMKRYNLQDTLLLEKVYLKLLPLMNNHPRGQFQGKYECEKCGSTRMKSDGLRRQRTCIKRSLRCLDCGGYQSIIVSKIK